MADQAEATAKKNAPGKTSAGRKPVKLATDKQAKATPKSIAKIPKKPKAKVVRDFSIPQAEYQKIAEIREACLKVGLRVKKSEILRAGLKALGAMDEAQLKRVIAGLGKIKSGRSKKP